jgi:chromate reductase, NAD(P)H dehydrogenase (quinone)
MRVLGISGSLRRESHNTRLLRAAASELPPGASFELFDGLAELPAFCEDIDVEPAHEPVARLREAIDAADALLIATPEYNASIPGVLKNAIDWASRPFPDNVLRGKPVVVIGASTGLFGAVWAQAELRKVLKHTGALVLEDELPVGLADGAFTEAGELAERELRERLAALVEALCNVGRVDERFERRDRAPALRAG